MRLCVRNLLPTLTADQLRDLVAPYRPTAQIALSLDEDTDQSRGWGFVEIPDAAAAQRALAGLNGGLVKGHRLVVEPAYQQGTRNAPRREGQRSRATHRR
jgi:RNA recognition motif-containing protein